MTTHQPPAPKKRKKATTPPPQAKVGTLLAQRPTEAISGLGLAAAVYGFLAEAGVDNVVAAIIAVVVGVLPYVVSEAVDRIRAKER